MRFLILPPVAFLFKIKDLFFRFRNVEHRSGSVEIHELSSQGSVESLQSNCSDSSSLVGYINEAFPLPEDSTDDVVVYPPLCGVETLSNVAHETNVSSDESELEIPMDIMESSSLSNFESDHQQDQRNECDSVEIDSQQPCCSKNGTEQENLGDSQQEDNDPKQAQHDTQTEEDDPPKIRNPTEDDEDKNDEKEDESKELLKLILGNCNYILWPSIGILRKILMVIIFIFCDYVVERLYIMSALLIAHITPR